MNFNFIAYYILLKGYQKGNHIKLSEQRLQELSIRKNARGQFFAKLFLAAVVLTALCGCRSGSPYARRYDVALKYEILWLRKNVQHQCNITKY